MKTIIAAILFSTFSLGAFAQQSASSNSSTQKASPAAKVTDSYRCPICGYTGTKAGDCPKDKVTLVKVGDYYCPECYMTEKKSGKCTMCGVEMKKMEPATASNTKK
jgi:predicted RNA-binding Zn-ribbon protein involved in translation (DUF1610 family)